MAHVPVLLKEVLEGLDLQKGEVVLDGTVGNAGHAREMLKMVGKEGQVIGLDQDKEILQRIKPEKNLILINENFRNLDRALESLKIEYVNKILFDLGINSDQIEASGRGFTFLKDEPLLMNMSGGGLTAREIINRWTEKEIADIIYKYGEERLSRRIARGIAERRKIRPIETTLDLVEIIRLAVPAAYRNNRRLHCATRTFQALRIAVNDELGALEDGLLKAWQALAGGGRLAVISFHSLEDRIVKNYFREKKATGEGKILTKKPIVPGEAEERENPRSRSAKLRVIEKI